MDLFDRGWDLARLWRRRRWRLLLNVIEHLPRNSHYGEALALDESLVDPNAKPSSNARPSVREWSPEVELLAAIFDRMNAFIQTQAEKNLRLKPWPGPLTAAELLKQYQRAQNRTRLERLIADAQQRHRDN